MKSTFRIAAVFSIGLCGLVPASTAWSECNANIALEQASSRFVIKDDLVYDPTTDLTWMRCSFGQTWVRGVGCQGAVQPMDWNAAMSLRISGDASWRLPSIQELNSIVDVDCKKPAIDESAFPNTAHMAYWSSTPTGPSYAWHVNFRWGVEAWQYLRSNQYAVRLVRSGH